ncbi:MAG: AraC family transcriptional regulator [Clostridia bacterium]|nr:AraC family transcriptional regulator [Clostridia bacterium]
MHWESFDIVEQININRLYTLYKMHFNKDYNFAGEMHDFWECMYILEGEMTVSADEKVHTLSYGDMILFKPYELHKFIVNDKDGATVLTFTFDMQGDFCKAIEGRAYHLKHFQRSIIRTFLVYLDFEIKQNKSIKDKEFYWNVLPYFKENHIFLQTVSFFISRILLSLSDAGTTLSKTKTYETELFKRALQIMNENIDTSLSVDVIASWLNISTSSLKRLFEKYAGMSVHKYFLTLKIKTATLMLKGGASVNEVSDKLGFSSAGYFSCVYKRETGINPSQV